MHWIAQEEYNKKETKLVFTVAVVEQLWISKSVVCSYIIVKQMPCTSRRENKLLYYISNTKSTQMNNDKKLKINFIKKTCFYNVSGWKLYILM